jgi:hypothetical protein
VPPSRSGRSRRRRSAKLAAQGEQDFGPVMPHRHMDRHQSGKQGEGEEERGSQVNHSLIPLLIHNRPTHVVPI